MDQNNNNKDNKSKVYNKNPYNNPRVSINEDIVRDHIKSRRSMFNMIEIGGYKAANFIHKFATMSLILFFAGNVIYGLYAYNTYWKYKRQSYLEVKDIEE